MFARSAFVLAALAASVSAQLQILSPGGPDLWWVADSQNNIVWTCKTSPVENFTILISNSDENVLVAPLAVVAVQHNFDCSRTLTTQQVDFTAGTGYKISLANPINNTEVYAESEEFEIKAVGAAYPDPSSTPAADGSSSASNTATSSDSEPTSGDSDDGAIAQMAASPVTFGAFLVGALAMLAL